MNFPEHIASQFDADLQAMRANIIQMGGLAEAQLRSALQMFVECDGTGVDALVARDHDIDHMELEVDRQIANLIARRQPVAIDLRFVVVISKMVTDLERIGDEAKKIARSTNRGGDWETRQSLTREFGIADLGQLAADQLADALNAYVRLDLLLAQRARGSDKAINAAYRDICQRLTTRMTEQPQTVAAAVELLTIARSLERIGDHAKKISKYVIFVVSGEDVRHTSQKGA